MAAAKIRSELRFILNGRDVTLRDVGPDQTLLDWLRLSRLLKGTKDSDRKAVLPPGPNSPVGVYWLGLSKPHWGIHGTPHPARVGTAESNGCIHLTNWDVLRLAQVVKTGFGVDVHA